MTREELYKPFLADLLATRTPSGYEDEARAVLEKYLKPVASEWEGDLLGNRFARIGKPGGLHVMVSGHMDEIGFIVSYIHNRGFLHFDTLGGHDVPLIAGRPVMIMGSFGPVRGVIGKKAIHLQAPNERKKLPEVHELWIDIGAETEAEARQLVREGDPATYDCGFGWLLGTRAHARGFDNKIGTYVANEVLRRLAPGYDGPRLTALSTAMEEVGTRGMIPSIEREAPDVAIVVEVGHATEMPDSDFRRTGAFELGKGPILTRGPNVHPGVFRRLIETAEERKIPFQIKAESKPAGNDARSAQIGAKGVATAVVAVPLRYMHTATEVVEMKDVEASIQLIKGFVETCRRDESFIY
ncbi:MAG: M42 family peptidase [Puniceicoccaceae bacterium]